MSLKNYLLVLALTTGNAFASSPPCGILGLNEYPTGIEVHLQTGGNSHTLSHKSLPSGEGRFLVTGFAKVGSQPFVTLYDSKTTERLAISHQPDAKGNKILTLKSDGPSLSTVSGTAWIHNQQTPFGGVYASTGDATSPPSPPLSKVVLLSDFSEVSARKQGIAKGFQSLWNATPLLTESKTLWEEGEQYPFLLENPLPPECSYEELLAAKQGLLKKGSDGVAPKLHLLTSKERSSEPLRSPAKSLSDLLSFDQNAYNNTPKGHITPFIPLHSNSFSLEYQRGKGMISVNSEKAFYEGYSHGWRLGVKQYFSAPSDSENNAPHPPNKSSNWVGVPFGDIP